jgi:hypothetical protein
MIENLKSHRPAGYPEHEAKTLCRIANDLFSVLSATQASLAYETLVLSEPELQELSLVIVEFAEDLLNGLGIWQSLEAYNHRFFATALPFSMSTNCRIAAGTITRERIHHLLWNKYSELCEGLLMAPGHGDLRLLVEDVYQFFSDHRKDDFPEKSSVKALIDQPNAHGWDIKRKLLWLGRHSYLFRHSYAAYIEEQGEQAKISIIDDFVCQHATHWSGLGVPDILAAILDISDSHRDELRTWYLRHFAYYQVESIKGPVLYANNTVCKKQYAIRVGEHSSKFKVGYVYLGSLVPWNDEWYWSGRQHAVGRVSGDVMEELVGTFLQKQSRIAYRYSDSLRKKARDRIEVHYDNFVDFHGDDMVVFPDGYAMAAAMQKQHRVEYEAHPQEAIEKVMENHNLKNPWPSSSYPPALLNSTTGVGVFFNRDEGQEIMPGFDYILQGLEKKGVDMTEDETDSIRGLIKSPAISPKFVEKLVERHGVESVAEAFLYRDGKGMDYLHYALRRYKGQYYKMRYPNMYFC